MRRGPKLPHLTPMQERLAGLAAGAVLAVPLWLWIAPRFFGAHIEGDVFASAAVFTYTNTAILVTVVLGLCLGGAGFVVGADRQFWNFALVGAGIGLLLVAAPWFAAEKLEMTPEGFAYRSWWGLANERFAFADLAELRMPHHARPWSRRGGWFSGEGKTKAGEAIPLCSDTSQNPLWFWATPHLMRMGRIVPNVKP